MRKTISRMIPIVGLAFMLAGCSTPFVNPPIPAYATKKTGGDAAGGAVVGAWAGAATTADAVTTGGIGTLVGAAIGTYASSTHHQVKWLQSEGVYVVQVGDHLQIIMPSDKLFEYGHAIITPQGANILNHVTNFLYRFGDVPITLTGYTDNVRAPSFNMRLSMKQAQSVAAYLWSHGIPYQNLHPQGRGQQFPVANNYTSVGSGFNRRVVLSLPVMRHPHHG